MTENIIELLYIACMLLFMWMMRKNHKILRTYRKLQRHDIEQRIALLKAISDEMQNGLKPKFKRIPKEQEN